MMDIPVPVEAWNFLAQTPFAAFALLLLFRTESKIEHLSEAILQLSEKLTKLTTFLLIRAKIGGENVDF